MFGTGLSRPLDGIWLQMGEWANEQDNLTIAIDMPSGMYVDKPADGVVMYADLVLAFQQERYEDQVVGNANWVGGDWNCDGEFTSGDLIVAFQSGGYRAAAASSTRQDRGRSLIFSDPSDEWRGAAEEEDARSGALP